MKQKRSRIALFGTLALALCVTVGLLGGAAEAKKKGKKKGAKTFTVTKTAPTAIPLATETGATDRTGFIKVPIGTVGGKKLKGKVISFSTLSVTTTFSGGAGFASNVGVTLIGPNGRNVGIRNPFSDGATPPTETVSGPTTETPNTSTDVCIPFTSGAYTQPPCPDPDDTVGPPYAGTIQNGDLVEFGGMSPNGTWTVKLSNSSTTIPATLNSITVTGNLLNAPPST